MRSQEEIQHAHDVLTAVASGAVDLTRPLDEPTRQTLSAMASVLCWLLEHRDQTFGQVVRSAESLIAEAGPVEQPAPAKILEWRPARRADLN